MPISDIGLEAEFTLERERGGIVEEPPFRILVLGNWSGALEKRPDADRKPIEIDRDNFDDIMARLNTRVDLAFDDGAALSLDVASIDDLHPDKIFRSIPLFSELRDLRKRLRNDDTFNAAARDARQMFGISGEPVSAAAAINEDDVATGGLLDAILTQPSGGAAAPKRGASGELGSLVKELVRPHLVSIDEDEQSTLVAAVDSATSQLMRSILHHRGFQELEAAWRGLFFLVRRADTSSDLKIYLLDVSKDEMADDLKSAESLSSTFLYSTLVKDALETPGADPWAFVCANYSFSPNVDDVATLMRTSKICAAAGAPFVAHMRPDVLGVHSMAKHPDPAGWSDFTVIDESEDMIDTDE